MIRNMRTLVTARLATGLLLCLWVPAHGDNPKPPARRHVALEGQSNFRDIGGYKTRNGEVSQSSPRIACSSHQAEGRATRGFGPATLVYCRTIWYSI